MPEAVVFILRAVVLVLLWGFVVAAIVAVRHDVFGVRPARSAAAAPAAPSGRRPAHAPAAAPTPAARSDRRGDPVARRLVVVAGAQRGLAVDLGAGPVTLGRATDSTLVLSDDYASNHHARLVTRGHQWLLEDTGSTNGTFVAGAKVAAPTPVEVGSQITIGRTTLELQP
jgi:hypothetical protein